MRRHRCAARELELELADLGLDAVELELRSTPARRATRSAPKPMSIEAAPNGGYSRAAPTEVPTPLCGQRPPLDVGAEPAAFTTACLAAKRGRLDSSGP